MPPTPPLIGYLAHDLADPAIARRVAMFHTGGANVTLAGLLRGTQPPALPDPLILGRSADAHLADRAATVLRVLATGLPRLADRMHGAQAIVARNLEMLMLGYALTRRMTPRPRLIYECLDIHRLLTSPAPAGRALRTVENRLGRAVDLVLTSSPAFITHHLGQCPFADRILLVENKVLGDAPQLSRPPAPPYRIGWYGALRCERSFRLLADLSDRMGGSVEISLRGRPTTAIFPDLAARVAQHPHMSFGGPYTAADLPALYADVHFAWCIDFYEQGANSDWLLPNRLYESAAHGAIPVALATVETGRFLERHAIGLTLADTGDLTPLFSTMTPDRTVALQQAVARSDPHLWRADAEDCRALVNAITAQAFP